MPHLCRTAPAEPKVKNMAHTRRQKENDTFAEIAQTLPTKEHTKDLDKASVLRVAINFMRLRNFIGEGEQEPPEQLEEEELGEQAAGVCVRVWGHVVVGSYYPSMHSVHCMQQLIPSVP